MESKGQWALPTSSLVLASGGSRDGSLLGVGGYVLEDLPLLHHLGEVHVWASRVLVPAIPRRTATEGAK